MVLSRSLCTVLNCPEMLYALMLCPTTKPLLRLAAELKCLSFSFQGLNPTYPHMLLSL